MSWPREGTALEFRSEFFNAFNHPQFDDPDVEFTSPTIRSDFKDHRESTSRAVRLEVEFLMGRRLALEAPSPVLTAARSLTSIRPGDQ